jgi:hypothetical protein
LLVLVHGAAMEAEDIINGRLTPEQAEDLLIEVTSGRAVFEFRGDLYATRQPTMAEQDRARIVYRRHLQDAKLKGCPSRAEMETWGLETEKLDRDERQEKEHLIELVHRRRANREKCTDPDQKLEIDAEIGASIARLEEIERNEYELLQHCREEKAERARQLYFVACCTMGGSMLDQPNWASYEDFQKSSTISFISAARRALVRVSRGMPITVIRALARSNEWRSRWKASKESSAAPFDGSASSWDKNKIALIYWSDFYDSIYAHQEAPTEETIVNDEALQMWINQQVAKRKTQAKMPNGGGGRPLTYTAGGRQRTMTKIGESTIAVNTPVKVRT